MMKRHIILPILNRCVVLLTLAMATNPLAATQQNDSTIAQVQVCSEMCVMAQSQDYLIEITRSRRPVWSETISREITPYTVCGIRIISQSGIDLYDDFDETDRAFDQAFTGCTEEREAFNDRVRTKLIEDGVFATAEEADAQISPLRAMLFGAKMASAFDDAGPFSKGNQYAESRFPEFCAEFQSRKAPSLPEPPK